jgi:hypothetical protein
MDCAVNNIVNLMTLLESPPVAPKPEIGFHVKADAIPYRIRRKAKSVL